MEKETKYIETVIDHSKPDNLIQFHSDRSTTIGLHIDALTTAKGIIGLLTTALLTVIRGSKEIGMSEGDLMRKAIAILNGEPVDFTGINNHMRIEIETDGEVNNLSILKREDLYNARTPQEITEIDLKHLSASILVWLNGIFESHPKTKKELRQGILDVLMEGFTSNEMDVIASFNIVKPEVKIRQSPKDFL